MVGRPDGRLSALAASEAAVLMSVQQARYVSARPERGVEIVSVGHNPFAKTGLFQRRVTLPIDQRRGFLSMQLLSTETGGHDPSAVVAKTQAIISQGRHGTVQ